MLELKTPYDFEAYVGKKLGTSDWMTIDQKLIDDFAAVSGDRNWIHIDVDRAKQELPDGKTIAHGMLTLSLVTDLGANIAKVLERSKGVNYGSNKVRFTAPVQVGSRIRLHRTLLKFERAEGGARLTFSNEVEIEGKQRPALVAETISMMYAKGN
jgi:acyl dehydratase